MKACGTQSFIHGNNAMATFVSPLNWEESKAAMENEWEFLDNLVGGMGLKTRE